MSRCYGCQSMVDPLRSVVVRPPDDAFSRADPHHWHYAHPPDLAAARLEHDALVEILLAAGAEVLTHDRPLPGLADAVFVHDPALLTDGGAVVLRMGKPLRRGEEDALADFLATQGVPILGTLEGDAHAEGGDLVWLDRHTLAVGQGFRSNAAGAHQLEALLTPLGVRVLPVPLPWHGGPDACLHLMSLLSILDRDLAVVHRPLLPVPFVMELEGRGFRLVDVPPEELPTQGPNVLALAPRRCVVLDGNPVTRRRLEAAGCEVTVWSSPALAHTAEGGPTCLTRPVWRSGEVKPDARR